MIHQLHRQQIIPASLERVWDYFSRPGNLNEITPPDLQFQVLFGRDEPIYQEELMATRSSSSPFKNQLTVRISQVREPCYFAYLLWEESFQFWVYEHFFIPVSRGVEKGDRGSGQGTGRG